jgi:hypothetical protein
MIAFLRQDARLVCGIRTNVSDASLIHACGKRFIVANCEFGNSAKRSYRFEMHRTEDIQAFVQKIDVNAAYDPETLLLSRIHGNRPGLDPKVHDIRYTSKPVVSFSFHKNLQWKSFGAGFFLHNDSDLSEQASPCVSIK